MECIFCSQPTRGGPCRHNSIKKKKKKSRHSPKARLNCFYGQGSQLVVFKSGCLVGTSPPPGLAKGILIPPPSLLLAQDYRSLEILNKTASCLDRNRDKRSIPEKREWPGVAGNGVGFWEGAEGIKPKETPPEQVQRSKQRQLSACLFGSGPDFYSLSASASGWRGIVSACAIYVGTLFKEYSS